MSAFQTTCEDCGLTYMVSVVGSWTSARHFCQPTERPKPSFLERVREIARECGYAVAVHGSEKRDLDLVAIPWIIEAEPAEYLVDRLCAEIGLVPREMPDPWQTEQPEDKPHGRRAWSLNGCPDHLYVDLSVMPIGGAEGGEILLAAYPGLTREQDAPIVGGVEFNLCLDDGGHFWAEGHRGDAPPTCGRCGYNPAWLPGGTNAEAA